MKQRLFRISFILTALAAAVLAEPRWQRVTSPVRENLKRLVFTGPDRGFIAGTTLLEIRNGACRLAVPPPDGCPVVSLMRPGPGEVVAIADQGVTSESRLYVLRNDRWEHLYHPMANQVCTIVRLPDGRMLLGGMEEAAVSTANAWTMIAAAPLGNNARDVVALDNEHCLFLRGDYSLLLFSLSDQTWHTMFPPGMVKALTGNSRGEAVILTGDTIRTFVRGSWKVHSADPLLRTIRKLTYTAGGSLWGVGDRGMILHYGRNGWIRESTPTPADLHDIVMVGEEEGWCVGTAGTILHRTSSLVPEGRSVHGGFDLMKVTEYGRDLDDEYGIAFEDLTGDGKPDLYTVCLFDPNRFYINKTTSSFSPSTLPDLMEESASRGMTGRTGESILMGGSELFIGVGVADVDNDGDQDCYLCGLINRNRLLLNDGTGFFRNVSLQARRATDSIDRTNAAVFGDVDNDGDLDLFVANENNTNRLFLNNGNGYFDEATAAAGLQTIRGGTSAVFGDIDNDGDLDLFVANWTEPNILYRNDSSPGRVRFNDMTEAAGVGGPAWTKSNASVFADFDNDGDLDLFVANRRACNALYRNDGTGRFTDVTAEVLGVDSLQTYGAVFADVDHDGFLDLFITNVGGSRLYRNDQRGHLMDVTMALGANISGYGTGTACADVDGDGDIDIYAGVFTGGSSRLLINRVNDSNYVTVLVHGSSSNRDGIGAKVRLFRIDPASGRNELTGFREVSGGSGYGSSSAKRIHFGAPASFRYIVEVEFPASGIRRRVGPVTAGTNLDIEEEEGRAAGFTRFQRFVTRTATDPEVLGEASKGLLAIFLAFISFRNGRRRLAWKGSMIVLVHVAVVFICLFQMRLFFESSILISTVLPISSVPVLLILVYLYYERVILAKRLQSEKEATRNRIARDLHDDLASTLGGASIYAQSLLRSTDRLSETDQRSLAEVNALLGEASDAVTDIVWTVSPRHDRLDDLILRLQAWIADGCRVRGIEFTGEIADGSAGVPIVDDIRRNVYLVFKEAANNAFKHAHATEVRFRVEIHAAGLTLSLSDNGAGMRMPESGGAPPNEPGVPSGNGLTNMRRRAEEIGADLTIDSAEGRGTTVRLSLKMIHMHH